jgi:hypothetical protein
MQVKPAKLLLVKKNAAVPTFNFDSNLGNRESLIKDDSNNIAKSPARVSRYDSSTDVSVDNTSQEDVANVAKKDVSSLQVHANKGQNTLPKGTATLTDTPQTTKKSSIGNIPSASTLSSKSTGSISDTQSNDKKSDQERDEKLQEIENKIESVIFRRKLESVEKKLDVLKRNAPVSNSGNNKVNIDESTKNMNANSCQPVDDSSNKKDDAKKDGSKKIETLISNKVNDLALNKNKTLIDNIEDKIKTIKTNLNQAIGEKIVDNNINAEKSVQSVNHKISTNDVKQSNKEPSINVPKIAVKSVASTTPPIKNGVTAAKKPSTKKVATPKTTLKTPKASETVVKTGKVISLTPKTIATTSANTLTSERAVTTNKVISSIPKTSNAKKASTVASNMSAASKNANASPKISVNNEKLISLSSLTANSNKNIAGPTNTTFQNEVTFNVTNNTIKPRKQINKIVMDTEDGNQRYIVEDGNARNVYEDDNEHYVSQDDNEDGNERYVYEEDSFDLGGETDNYYDDNALPSSSKENKPFINYNDDLLTVTVNNADFPKSAKRRRSRDDSSPSFTEEDYEQAGPSIRSRLTLDRPGPSSRSGPPAKKQKIAKICKFFNNGGCAFGKFCFNIHDLRRNLDVGGGHENKKFRLISDKKYSIKFEKEKIHVRLETEKEEDFQLLLQSKVS